MTSHYPIQAMRTNSTNTGRGAHSPDLVHAALGMADELYEFQTAKGKLNALEELGDMCWFIALAATAIGREDVFTNYTGMVAEHPDSPLIAECVNLTVSAVKKNYAYGAPIDSDYMAYYLAILLDRIDILAQQYGRSLDDLCHANLAKLQARYPEKFTIKDALQRDLKAEAIAMRGSLQ